MKNNLDSLRAEIEEHLRARGIAVFYGFPKSFTDMAAVYWDREDKPGYRDFVAAAEAAGARLMTLYANRFSEETIEDALDRLEASAMPREDRREIERRLRELRGYVGFTCQIELSFDLAPRVYVFDVRTEWFEEMDELLDRIEDASGVEDDDPIGGGYFSKN